MRSDINTANKKVAGMLESASTLACKLHALYIARKFTFTLPLKIQYGIGIWNHFTLFDMMSRLVAGCRRNQRKIIIEKARKKNSIAICQARSSNIEQGRFRTYPNAMTLRTYGIGFYQITKQLQGEFTAQGGSGTLRWIKYPP